MTLFYHYRLYGLTVRSNYPLLYVHPVPLSSPADVEILFSREVHASPPSDVESELRFEQTFPNQSSIQGWRTPNGILIVYTSGGDSAHLVIDAHGGIRVSLPLSLPLEDLLPIVYGTALSAALQIKGLTCLHASAVAAAGQGILFVGASGMGKSTLAAALVERGLQFISDDVAVLLETPDFVVQPGANAARLWSNATPRKLWQPMSASEAAVPIRLIYLLGKTSGQPGIFPLSKRDGFLTLSKHRYASALLPADRQTGSLERLRRVIDQLPIRLIVRSRVLDDLPAIVALVERDVQTMLEASS